MSTDDSKLSCSSCRLSFSSSIEHREHYKSDWHRYNIRRKTLELPYHPLEEYMVRYAIHQSTLENSDQKVLCSYCEKTFPSLKGLENHYNSGKHGNVSDPMSKNSNATYSEPCNDSESALDPSVVFKETLAEHRLHNQPPDVRQCLFCLIPQHFLSIEDNIDHMIKAHSFYIPDAEFITDLDGLVQYLGEKVSVLRVCLMCRPCHQYQSILGVKRHMLDKGHTMIAFDGETANICELSPFYDYDKYGATSEDDDQFEDVSDSEGSLCELNDCFVDQDQSEFVLPSGKRIGHRDYRRYYKQNLPLSSNLLTENEQEPRGRARDKLLYSTPPLPTAISNSEARAQRRYLKDLSKKMMKLGVKQNLFQPHFREQIL